LVSGKCWYPVGGGVGLRLEIQCSVDIGEVFLRGNKKNLLFSES